jgi:hypothetical protein
MRNFAILLLIFAFSVSVAGQTPMRTNIKSYTIKMKLDTISRRIEIRNLINIEKADTNRKSKLFLSSNIDIDSAKVNGRKLKLSRAGDTLCLQISIVKSNKLTFWYSIPIDLFTYDKAIVLTRGMKWCPYLQDNISALNSEVTVPVGYKVYSSGSLESKSMEENNITYKYSNRINSGLPFIIAPIDYYSEITKHQNGFSIKYCFLNKNTSLQNSIISESLSTLNFCTNHIGNYKRKQLTYIEVPNFGSAQSLETFILMSSEFIKYFGLSQNMRFWVSHETIHQWIGVGYFNSIYTSPKYGTFIEESLTEYLRYVYIEKTFGKDSLAGQIKYVVNIYNTEIKGTDQDVSISINIPSRVIYCNAPLIFHVVRMDIGDIKWQSFIRKLYSKYYGRGVGFDDFIKTLKLYANNAVINQMEKYINTKGIPDKIVYK